MRIFPSRRTVKRWGIAIACIIGLLLLGNGAMVWRTDAHHERILAAIRANGDPASIADLRPAPLPDDENAAAQIAALGDEMKVFGKDHITFLERTPLGKAFDKADKPPNAEQAAAMRAILDKNTALGEGITRAAACNVWASRADFSVDHQKFLEQLYERISLFRGVSRYAQWEIVVLAHEGKSDAAVRRGIEMLKLARLHEAEPTLVAYMMAIAVRNVTIDALPAALAAAPISPALHKELDRELARAEDPRSVAKMLRLERAVAMDTFPSAIVNVNPIHLKLLGWPMKRFYLDAYESMAELVAASDGPWEQFRQQVRPGGAVGVPTGHGVLADLLAPAVAATVESRDRDLTMVRALRVLNALQQFAEANGREASGLAELGLPAEATVDPYSGAPLILKHTDAGWLVYGLGKNEQDDGGNFEEWLDVGVGAAREAEGD